MEHVVRLNEAVDILVAKPLNRSDEEVARLSTFLRAQQGFLQLLAPSHCQIICKWLGHVHVPAGHEVYAKGELGECMYIIIDGFCDVKLEDNPKVPADKGLLHRGLAFGEVALVSPHKPRNSTVLGGKGGAHLAVMHRGSLNHLRFMAQTQPLVGEAVQGLLAACCTHVLHTPPSARSKEDVEVLAEFMKSMEAFKNLPEALLQHLAHDCTYMQLPVGWILFEEDSPGHSMYVVVAGQCHVRARPLPTACGPGGGAGLAQHAHHHHHHSGGMGSGASSSLHTAAEPSFTTGTASATPRGAHSRQLSGRTLGGARRSFGSTAGATSDGFSEPEPGSDEEEMRQREALRLQRTSSTNAGGQVKDSPFWIAKFMEDACKRLSINDLSSGLGHGITPLAAVAAAKWRQVVLSGRANRGGAASGDGGPEDAPEPPAPDASTNAGMEALLGRAAARALRTAQQEREQGYASGDAATPQPPSQPAPGDPRVSALVLPDADDSTLQPDITFTPHMPHTPGDAQPRRSTPGASAVPAAALEDPAKRLLLKLGNADPSNVSRALVGELVQRADVGVVLYEVAKRMLRRGGGPRRISRKASKRISAALQHRIREGADAVVDTVAGYRVLGRNASVPPRTLPAHGAADGSHTERTLSSQASGGPSAAGRGVLRSGGRHRASATLSLAMVAGAHSAGSGLDDDDETDWGDGESDLATTSLASGAPSRLLSLLGGLGGRRRTTQELPEFNNFLSTEVLGPEELERQYGPTVRSVGPGHSFGELALLHRESRRTATVVAGPPEGAAACAPHPEGGPQLVELICISRTVYSHTVRAVQVGQLQGLLHFLGGLAPFARLDEQQRMALAIFCRPRIAAAGTVLAAAGEVMDALFMVQEGEVVLVDDSSLKAALTAPPGSGRALLHAGSAKAGGSATDYAATRALLRQLSAPERAAAAAGGGGGGTKDKGGVKTQQRDDPRRRVMFDSNTRADAPGGHTEATAAVLPPGVLQGATLSSMGAGGVFGEGLLAHVTFAKKSEPEEGSGAKRSQPKPKQKPPARYPYTVVARRATKLLTVTATDLARFGPGVAAGLAALAEARGGLLLQRAASVSSAKSVVEERVEAGRRLLLEVAQHEAAGIPIDANTALHAAVVAEQRQAAAAGGWAEQQQQAAAGAPPALQRSSSHGSNGMQALLSKSGKGMCVPGMYIPAAGGRPMPAPPALPRSNSLPTVRAAWVGGVRELPAQPEQLPHHPLAGKLHSVLAVGTPQLPPRDPQTMAPMQLAHQVVQAGVGTQHAQAPTRDTLSLSTIAEEDTPGGGGGGFGTSVARSAASSLGGAPPEAAPAASSSLVFVTSPGVVEVEEEVEEVEGRSSTGGGAPSGGVLHEMRQQLAAFYQQHEQLQHALHRGGAAAGPGAASVEAAAPDAVTAEGHGVADAAVQDAYGEAEEAVLQQPEISCQSSSSSSIGLPPLRVGGSQSGSRKSLGMSPGATAGAAAGSGLQPLVQQPSHSGSIRSLPSGSGSGAAAAAVTPAGGPLFPPLAEQRSSGTVSSLSSADSLPHLGAKRGMRHSGDGPQPLPVLATAGSRRSFSSSADGHTAQRQLLHRSSSSNASATSSVGEKLPALGKASSFRAQASAGSLEQAGHSAAVLSPTLERTASIASSGIGVDGEGVSRTGRSFTRLPSVSSTGRSIYTDDDPHSPPLPEYSELAKRPVGRPLAAIGSRPALAAHHSLSGATSASESSFRFATAGGLPLQASATAPSTAAVQPAPAAAAAEEAPSEQSSVIADGDDGVITMTLEEMRELAMTGGLPDRGLRLPQRVTALAAAQRALEGGAYSYSPSSGWRSVHHEDGGSPRVMAY